MDEVAGADSISVPAWYRLELGGLIVDEADRGLRGEGDGRDRDKPSERDDATQVPDPHSGVGRSVQSTMAVFVLFAATARAGLVSADAQALRSCALG